MGQPIHPTSSSGALPSQRPRGKSRLSVTIPASSPPGPSPSTLTPAIRPMLSPKVRPFCTREYIFHFGLLCQLTSFCAGLCAIFFWLSPRYYISSRIHFENQKSNLAAALTVLVVFYFLYVLHALLGSSTAHVLSERVGRHFAIDELKAFIACNPEIYMSTYNPTKCSGKTWKTVSFTTWVNEDKNVDISRLNWPSPFTILHIKEQLLIDDEILQDAVRLFQARNCCRIKVSKRCADATFSRRLLVITGVRKWWMSRIVFIMAALVGLASLQSWLLLKRTTAVQITLRKRVFGLSASTPDECHLSPENFRN